MTVIKAAARPDANQQPRIMQTRCRKKSLGLAPLDAEARREGVLLTRTAEYPVRLICRATG